MAKTGEGSTIHSYIFILFIVVLPLLKIDSLLDQALFPRFAWVGLSILTLGAMAYQKIKLSHWPLGISMALGGFILIQILSVPAAVNSPESYASLARYSLMAAFFFTLLGLLKSQTLKAEAILKAVVLSTGIVSILTAFQLLQSLSNGVFFEDIYSITGPFTHKNLLTSGLMLGLPFTLAGWAILPSAWRKAALAVAILSVIEIFVLRTRGVWLGVFGAALATGLLFLLFKKKQEKLPLALIGGITALAVVILLGLFASSKIKAGITSSSNVDKRLTYWQNSWEMIQDHPTLGVGAGNWKLYFPKYGLSEVDNSTMQGITHIQRPHNDFLWVWAESGPLGLLFFLGLFILPILQVVKNLKLAQTAQERSLNYFAFMTVVAYGIFSFSDFPLERAPHTVLFFTALAVIFSSASAEAKTFKAPFLPAALGVLTLAALWVCGLRWQGEKNTVAVLEANAQQNAQAIIPAAEEALNPMYNLDPYANPIHYYSALGYQFSNQPQQALQHALWAKEDAPYNILVYNALANAHNRLGQKQEALQYLDSALAISPKYKMAILLKANILMEQNRFADALDALNFYPSRSNEERYLRALATALRGTLKTYPQHGRFKPMMEYLQKQPRLEQPMDYIRAYRAELSRRRGTQL